jgi:hypothetical protein
VQMLHIIDTPVCMLNIADTLAYDNTLVGASYSLRVTNNDLWRMLEEVRTVDEGGPHYEQELIHL